MIMSGIVTEPPAAGASGAGPAAARVAAMAEGSGPAGSATPAVAVSSRPGPVSGGVRPRHPVQK